MVYIYASRLGLGYVLMQNNRVLAYTSQKLKPHELTYPTHDLELFAIVHALRIWRRHFYGVKCEIVTYHKSLNTSSSKKT